jgi:hypothetical protein
MSGLGTTSSGSSAEAAEPTTAPQQGSPPAPPLDPTAQGYLLEQYKLVVEMADRISERRQGVNNFYIGILSALALLYSLLEKAPTPWARAVLQSSLPIVAIILCVMWALLIASYRRINAAKYEVILEMEKRLPAAPYTDEWNRLGAGKARHYQVTKLEMAIPFLFALAFLALLVTAFLFR